MKHYRCRSSLVLAWFTVILLSLTQVVILAEDLKPEDVYQKTVQSVATLMVDKADGTQSQGSAFLTVKDGLAATAWHVVQDAKRVVAKFSSGEEFEVSGLVDKDEKRDVAIVRIKVFGRPCLPVNATDPSVGSKSYVIGAPKGLEFSIGEGLVSQIQTAEGIRFYQFSCPASPGSSGGPLVNAKGEAIGIVSRQLRDGQNLNFAMPMSYVLGLDSTLPTQPWGDVKIETPIVKRTPSEPAAVDTALGDAVVCVSDASVAVQGTLAVLRRPAFSEKTNFWTGDTKRTWQLLTPTYLFETQKDVSVRSTELSGLELDGPKGKLRDTLVKVLSSFSETIQGLMDAIKTIQKQSGWTPEAQDAVGKAMAAMSGANSFDPSCLTEMAKSKDFCNRIPEDVQQQLGISHSADWFKMSVLSFSRSPLTFMLVTEGGLAYKMGFRSNDTIISFDGQTPASLLKLKTVIKAAAEKDVECVIQRQGKETKLKIRVPKDLPAY